MAKRKYLYKNIKVVPYWNGYRPYYVHPNGGMELLAVCCTTRQMAYLVGKMEVDFMNKGEK